MSMREDIAGEAERFLEKSPRPALSGAVLRDGEVIAFACGDVVPGLEPVFEIGSIGKTFTTTLLALMAREGLVALDDPVARYRPQYPFSASVTLRHLSSHTAGLPANPASAWTMLTRGRAFVETFVPDDLEGFLCAQPARARAIGRFGYSNVGMALLGHLLAERLGMDYERAVTERILVPLGMHETRIDWRGYPEQRLMAGHGSGGRRMPPLAWRGMEPAGTWRSTVPDMVRFLGALAGTGDRAWAELARPMLEPVARVASDTRIGLGWMLSPLPGVGDVAWHAGGTFGQDAIVQWAVGRQSGVVLLSNRRPPFRHHLVRSRRLESLADRMLDLSLRG